MTLAELEYKYIVSTLKKLDFNLVETAKELGISRATLYRKIKEFGITKERDGKTDENNGT